MQRILRAKTAFALTNAGMFLILLKHKKNDNSMTKEFY